MNKNLFETLKCTEKYQHIESLFKNECNSITDILDRIEKVCNYLNEEYNAELDVNSTMLIAELFAQNFLQDDDMNKEDLTIGDIVSYICANDVFDFKFDNNMIVLDENNIPVIDQKNILLKADDYRAKANMIHVYSSLLYYMYGCFKPIMLPQRFDLIQRNCNALGIDLPDIPRTKDYKEYLLYYFDVNDRINLFQEENNLTDAEVCTCLYYVAPMLMEGNQNQELPRPTNVWFTGAGKRDFEFLDKLSSKSVWACNERTRKGDIVVIYCLSPRSYVHSIWRADSEGIFNPFDYYHCRTTVCNGVRVPEITYNDLRNDEFFKNVPIVRRHLNGLNGIELKANEYSELLRLIEEKGGDISLCPKLMESSNVDFGEIKLEKDVEEKILIPILKELGYSEDDWSRQLSQKAGRNEKAIPDFVFFPKGEKHFENAPLLIEAKLDMSSITEQKKAFKQGLSYSRMLKSKLFGICDKERLILYRIDKHGNFDYNSPVFENHWVVIYSDGIVKSELNQIMGREVIKSIKI